MLTNMPDTNGRPRRRPATARQQPRISITIRIPVESRDLLYDLADARAESLSDTVSAALVELTKVTGGFDADRERIERGRSA